MFPDRIPPPGDATLFFEQAARTEGFRLVAGVDEAGRGPLAGPVVAAAVMLPEGAALPGVTDSKKMTEKARERAFSVVFQEAIAIGIGVVSHGFIDEHNILNASLEAMKRAISTLDPAPEYLLIDGIHRVPLHLPQKCLKKGDQISLSISAASVVAKVYRDRIMLALHERFSEYGFSRNKGYGTAAHLESLRIYGASPVHRRTFRGVP
ncbi:MAG: ribonuclease HII [Deltaproteobacteria bacterium]|nr:ribonuclease HII [Deltaproteobacteria bacterium]